MSDRADSGGSPRDGASPSRADGGEPTDVIDLSQWRLNDLPDENSDEDWDDDRELFDPAGRLRRDLA